ncbi:platelet endothelial cell adhesion molecule [Xyrichtys novacula]|uniref:Platelet endothelial cell adhesion molecule n=1 Tax=Xyrichtys novacula TaxID=13765 RepID=A0AAV1GS24_XYRNO|nr:platelet endothelial cell adhesion molecule [Xyrichtys novacula]
MDPRAPRLLPVLLTGLLSLWQCARGQSSYTIDNVGLTIRPGSPVPSGTHVTLHCQVSISHYNVPNLTHTFLITHDDIMVHSSTTTEESIVYELKPARAADSGSYECRVTVGEKSKVSFSQGLNVTGLQTPILHLNKTSPYENEEFTATCSAPEEKGPLIFRFYQRFRNGKSEKIKQPAPSWNSSETTLVLRMVGDSVLYCDYEINLVSGPRRSKPSNEIQVIVKGLFITPVVNVLPSSTIYEGDVLEVVCKVVSDLKDIEVFLTRDRKILKQAAVSLSHRFRAQEGDTGELVCKAEWGNVQKETYQSITVKELFSKPTLSLEPMELFEGDRFKLTCSVSVYVPERLNNRSIKFSFYKDNDKLKDGETLTALASHQKNGNYSCKAQAASIHSHNFVKESQKLVIKAKVPVSKPMLRVVEGTLVLGKPFQIICHSDNGTLPIDYTLSGPHRWSEHKVSCSSWIRSAATTLNQHHRARVRSHPDYASQCWDVSEGQDLTLSCSVRRGSLPITFTWYHTKKDNPLDSQTFNKLEGSHRIIKVKGQDQGGYYCESTNSAEETKKSKIVMVGVKMAGWKKGLIAVFCLLLILASILVFLFRKRLLHFKRKRTAELSVKSAGTKVERLSLTQAEVNEAANVTPGIMGKSVWSEHVSGSESDDQNSLSSPEKQDPQYTEVPTRQVIPNKAPEEGETKKLNIEVHNSKPGVPEQTDGGSVEYAQLNHDANQHSEHCNHGEHCVQDEHTQQSNSSAEDNTVQDEPTQDPTPDC